MFRRHLENQRRGIQLSMLGLLSVCFINVAMSYIFNRVPLDKIIQWSQIHRRDIKTFGDVTCFHSSKCHLGISPI